MYDEEIREVWFSFILDSYYQQNSISDKGTWLMDDMIEAHVRKWRQWLWRYSYSTISSFITFAYSVTELLLHLCKIFYSYNIYLQNIPQQSESSKKDTFYFKLILVLKYMHVFLLLSYEIYVWIKISQFQNVIFSFLYA